MLTSGPPLLPRLIAASVCRKRWKLVKNGVSRSFLEMIPAVTVWSRPNGEPIASTQSPTWAAFESPSVTVGKILRRIDFHDRHVSLFIDADDAATIFFAGLQADDNSRRAFDHVLIGQNVAFGTDNEPAADAAGRPARLAAKHIEQRIVGRLLFFVFAVLVSDFGGGSHRFDVHHCGFNASGNFGKRSRKASGARAICASFCATVGRPESIAPTPIPASRQAAPRATIQTRSFRKMARSLKVVWSLARSNINTTFEKSCSRGSERATQNK